MVQPERILAQRQLHGASQKRYWDLTEKTVKHGLQTGQADRERYSKALAIWTHICNYVYIYMIIYIHISIDM